MSAGSTTGGSAGSPGVEGGDGGGHGGGHDAPAATGTVWTRSLSDEFWSGSVTPLMFSVSGGIIEDRMVGKGLRLARIRTTGSFLRYHHGHVYVNTDVLGEVLRFFPSIFLTEGVLAHLPRDVHDVLGSRERSLADLFHPRFVTTCARTLLSERGWSPFTNHRRFERQAQILLARARRGFGDEVASGGPEELLAALERVESEMGEFLDAAIWGVTYAYLLYPLVTTVSAKWLDEHEGRIAGWAMHRVPGNKTMEVNAALTELARVVRGSPALRAAIEADPLGLVEGGDGSLPGEHDLREGFRDLMARHGHRLCGRDLLHPSWQERPEVVMDLVLKAAEADERGAGAAPVPPPPPELGRRGSLGPLQRVLLELGIHYMPRYIHLRENMRYFADVFLARARRIALRLGDVYVERGVLGAREQIFFLFREEVEAAARGSTRDLSALARTRREEYEQGKTLKPAMRLVGDRPDEERTESSGADDGSALEGSGVSRGVVRGRARVVLDVDQFRDVVPGEILVTSATDPGWTCLFEVAGGLVMELGGILSHGAILAREYGLPAVAHIAGATERIRTGDLVEVDGLAGRVRIVEPAAGDGERPGPAPERASLQPAAP